ncbi:SEC-C metal-binding domain-containing protein [Saccharopolyspora sp. NPDC002578]
MSGDSSREAAIARAEELEADAEHSGERTDDLVEAASYWRNAHEPDRERAALLAAIDADSGDSLFDPRATYAEMLMRRGQRAEADALLNELMDDLTAREHTYIAASTAYQHAGDTAAALRWLHIGIGRLIPDVTDPDADLGVDDPGVELLRMRREIRTGLGEQPDDLDRALDMISDAAFDRDLSEAFFKEVADRHDVVVLHWPADALAELRSREPELPLPQDHDAHLLELQREMLLADRDGKRATVVDGSADGYAAFCAEVDLPTGAAGSLEQYRTDLLLRGEWRSWPPERNAACWCGSERKYKKCCGAPGRTDA